MSPNMHFDDDDEVCPDYNVAVSRSNTTTTTTSGYSDSSGSTESSVHWTSPFDAPRSPPPLRSFVTHSQLRRATTSPTNPLPSPPPLLRPERYVYTYSLLAAGAPLKFYISVEPSNGKPAPGNYTFRLSLKVNEVERPIGDSVSLRLSVDPRQLEFSVFLFPGKKNVVPADAVYSMRVWLRVNGIDHRLFGEDELWVGKDLDFGSIENASFARLKSVAPDALFYEVMVGHARVLLIVRWRHISGGLYKYSLDYEASGVGAELVNDLRLIVDGDPRSLRFLIYTVPVRSVPAGASHRLRLWLKSSVAPDAGAAHPAGDTSGHVYQRLWKSDVFKLGAWLDFEQLGPTLVMGTAVGAPQTVTMEARVRAQPPTPLGYQQDAKSSRV
ncbi:hypothetical protein B0H15DRAFT_583477 [Mycena belliarum]|uniref:Uncharacterized protein n=1 Tax=Mycena belliarum TaxID=1033014 RepID=A0AAD6UH76_9AGAR|nr:hypothetical protein B0H15DRAFT_583477 [Mycena belliae]